MKRKAEKKQTTQAPTAGLDETWRQLLLPMVSGIMETKQSMTEWVTAFGLSSVVKLMMTDAEQLAGPKGKHQKDRQYNHWGTKDTPFPYNGRRVTLPRPRVRTSDKRKEVTLPVVELFQSVDPVAERVIEQILLGVSMRGYEPSLGPAPKEVPSKGAKKSRASELFVKETTRRMKAELDQSLEKLELVGLMLDGLHVAGHTVVVALGIVAGGEKHALGLRLGSTENKAICVDLLQDLQQRGLSIKDRILVVTDGGKGLRWAIQDVFGDLAVVQRCTVHKRRNIKSYLPESRQKTVDKMLRDAYKSETYKTAKRRVKQVISWLERNGEEDAAASLREGMEETLTVQKLGLPAPLRRFFCTTNAVENLVSSIRRVSRNVTRWRDGKMVKRWTTLGLMHAQERFHRIKGYRHLPALVAALGKTTSLDQKKKSA